MAEDGRVNRRQILKGAGVVGVGALAALAPAKVFADTGEAEGLLGTWNAPHHHETGPFAGVTTDGNIAFAAGGALIAHDTDQQATGSGNWVKHGEKGFKFTFHTFVFQPNLPVGTKVKVRAQGTLNENSISGRFSFQIYDPSGHPIPPLHGTGSFGGARIPIEPI
jgi:hypothetical protein